MNITILKTKIERLIGSNKSMLIMGLVGMYLLSTGISLAAFSLFGKGSTGVSGPSVNINIPGINKPKLKTDQPRTEMCPINGLLYTKAEKAVWEKRRPITAVIENHEDSRPQSGLSRADVTYEAVAEGGITRTLNVFYCGIADDARIGPVRSARVYFVNWATEYGNPLFVHVGGANNICSNCPGGIKPRGDIAPEVDALRLLTTLGWRYKNGNDMDGGTNVGYPTMWRDYERIPGAATEHTYMASTDKLAEEAERRGFAAIGADGIAWDKNFVPWKFGKDSPLSSPTATNISFEFWSNKPDYNVEWKYDSKDNKYLRFNGGEAHVDMDNKEQLSAKNVVIALTKERGPVDKEGHMFYTTIGTGKMLLFQNGDVVVGTWSKLNAKSRTIFKDDKGKEILFVPGRIWIETVPDGNEINYQ